MTTIGVLGNNPGRIPVNVSPLMGEIMSAEGNAFTRKRCDEYIINYTAKYKAFRTPAWGYRAMFLMMHNYSETYGLNTLHKIISRWCRLSGANPKQVALTTANRLGVGVNSHINTLDHDTMTTLISSISKIENGVNAIEDDIEQGWILFIGAMYN